MSAAAVDREAMLPEAPAGLTRERDAYLVTLRLGELREACAAARVAARDEARAIGAIGVVLELDALPPLAGPDSVGVWLRALTYCDRVCVGYVAEERAYRLEPRAQTALDAVVATRTALTALLGALVAERWPS